MPDTIGTWDEHARATEYLRMLMDTDDADARTDQIRGLAARIEAFERVHCLLAHDPIPKPANPAKG
jgi:hypothetical protein